MEKPKYEHIRGLSPTIAIEQKSASHNPRSTVGTVTEIYDYLRVLYARAGEQRCHLCGGAVAARSAAEIVDELCELPKAPRSRCSRPRSSTARASSASSCRRRGRKGFVRARIDGMVVRLEDVQGLEKLKKHTIELVIDRLTLATPDDKAARARLTDSVETALRAAKGQLRVLVDGEERPRAYSEARGCPKCGVGLPELGPQMLSFNSPLGMCQGCNGLGKVDLGWEHEHGEGWKLEGEECGDCGGLRLRPESRAVFLAGMSICDATALTVRRGAAALPHAQAGGRARSRSPSRCSRRSTRGSASSWTSGSTT